MCILASLTHIWIDHLDGAANHFISVELSTSQSPFWEGLVSSPMLNWPIFAVGCIIPSPFPLVAGPEVSGTFLSACGAVGTSLGVFGVSGGFLRPFVY